LLFAFVSFENEIEEAGVTNQSINKYGLAWFDSNRNNYALWN